MAGQIAAEAAVGASSGTVAGARTRNEFFFWFTVGLLALVVVGFTPTLYLRPAFDVAPIPGYLYIHGAVLTAWFVWLVLQTSLVRAGRTPAHRRFGIGGALIAAAVVFAGPLASFGVVRRVESQGVDFDADMGAVAPEIGAAGVSVIEFVAQVFWINLISITLFAVLVAAAILLRSNREAHKRCMLLASLAILGPALARISRISFLGGEGGPFTLLVMLGLSITLIAHDVIVRRRPHRVTLIGIGAIFIGGVIASIVAASEPGIAMVLLLRQP